MGISRYTAARWGIFLFSISSFPLQIHVGNSMIDVIVVSGLSRLSYCPEEILQTMEMLQSFQVQIDCIGYGILDYARLKQYLMHAWEKQEQFEQELDAYLCSCCTRERI